jgi:diaminohydroxyphosphoribosylaminopyrimidine deaminase/5-amino-6-(5-phosphoribosylamino)uracil reductase
MTSFSEHEQRHMARALCLAEKAKGMTFPNPAVGAVVVRDGTVVGTGATDVCGGPHAEVTALRRAGRRAGGATLFVTLEPCSHYGRTPPCTEAITRAGVAEVIAATRDPNPLVSGKGLAFLRRNGIAVRSGLLRNKARRLNEDYEWSITAGSAWVTLKLAMTLDGRVADSRGQSRWITAKASRAFVHELRRRHAAIAIGRQTLLADDPSLTVRHVQGKSPVRIVFSSSARYGYGTRLRRTAKEVRTVFVCPGGRVPKRSVATDGVEIWRTGYPQGKWHLVAALAMLNEDGLSSILLEGGRGLASSFLQHRLVNRLYLFYGNVLLGGGLEGVHFGKEPLPIDSPLRLKSREVRQFGDDVMISGIPGWSE